MTGTLELDRREMFSVFQAENIRFSDTDMIGHVNNVAFAALLESGRSAFSHARLFGHVPQGFLVVMARVEIDYRRELHWPARVDIGTRIVAVGRSSYTMGQGIFVDDTCYATGRTTLVMIDRQTRKSTPLSDTMRVALSCE